MNLYIDLKLPDELLKKIEDEAVSQMKLAITGNDSEMVRIIKDCVKGAIRSRINEILDGKDYRVFLRDKIAAELGITTSNDVAKNER